MEKIRKKHKGMTMTLRSHSRKEQPVCPPANIQTLPEEVLIEIFSYLSLGELCNTVSKVCTQWERLHWERQLYSLPRVLEDKGTIEDLLQCLNQKPHLASRYFDQVCIKEIIGKCLSTRHEIKRGTRELKDLIVILSHLTEVNVGRFGSPYEYYYEELDLAPLLRFCVQLEELKVGIRDNRRIHIRNAELTISLCEPLCGTLRVLHLDPGDWTLEVMRALTKCRHLEDLAMHKGDELTSECILEIGNISSIRRLSIDCLARVSYPEEPAETLLSMISNGTLKGLTHLRLADFGFGDEAAVAIGTNLINLTDLFITSFRRNHFVGDGLRSIIKGCSKLTSLQVKCYGYKTGLDDILMIPTYLPRLKTLELAVIRSRIDSINWQSALKEKMPDLNIR